MTTALHQHLQMGRSWPTHQPSRRPIAFGVSLEQHDLPGDIGVYDFAVLQSLSRLAGGADLEVIKYLLDGWGHNDIALLSNFANNFSIEQMYELARGGVDRDRLSKFARLGTGILSPAEIADYAVAHGRGRSKPTSSLSSVITVLPLQSAAALSGHYGLGGTLLNLFLYQSSDPAMTPT